uniref:Uncharacterized protein n=1 Tax=Arundo donax TaxID=35708 RepID=A0A0A9F266_ARUDO
MIFEVSNRRQTLQVLGAISFLGTHLTIHAFCTLLIPIRAAAARRSST